MYFAGARVLEMFQIGLVQGNITVSVGALSYAGQLNFGIVADGGAIADLQIFTEGLPAALDELGALTHRPHPDASNRWRPQPTQECAPPSGQRLKGNDDTAVSP
jgi:hypothetical protein